MRYIYLTVLAAALMSSVALVVRHIVGSGSPTAAPDAMTEELSHITAHYARMWDDQRGDALDDAHREEMRARWREAYHADVRACCERHGRPCPAWARD